MQIPDIISRKSFFIISFSLFTLNIVLKSLFLSNEPFWYDEIISIKASLLDFGHVKHEAEWDNNPPFYYYCLWVWNRIVGISEFKSRLLNVLFAAGSSVCLFALGKKLFNYKTGLAAGVLFTFHNFITQYAHEARAYTLVVLLVLISSLLFFYLIEKPNYKNWIGLGLVNFLIVYTHYIAGMVIPFQFFFLLFFYRDKLKTYIFSLLVCALLVLLRFTKKQFLTVFAFNDEGKSFWLAKADTNLLTDALNQLFGGKIIWVVFLTLTVISLILFLAKNKGQSFKNPAYYYCFLLGIVSIILLYIVGHFTPIFLGRYLLFSIPFSLLLLSWAIVSFNKHFQYAFPVLVVFQIAFLKLHFEKPMDYRLAVKVIREVRAKHPALIVLQTKDISGLFSFYYRKEIFTDYRNLDENLAAEKVLSINRPNELEQLNLKGEQNILVCQTFNTEKDVNEISEILNKAEYRFIKTVQLRGVLISMYTSTLH
jgi:uncharacterized membrane protein